MDARSPATSTETGSSSGRPGSREQGVPSSRTTLSGTPREILARLVQGDPLGIRDVVAKRIRSECVLLDADLVHLRVIARVARSAGRYHGRPSLEEWVAAIVLHTIGEVIREEHESARTHRRPCIHTPGAYESLAAPLGLESAAMRRACAVFNVLPQADRAAFIELVLQNRSLDEMAREQGEDATRIARRARRALDAILASAFPTERAKGSA